LSPEEKDQFKQDWKSRFGGGKMPAASESPATE
jgi:hypothetical protein